MDQYAQRITRDYPVRRKAQEKENMRTYLMGQLRALGYDAKLNDCGKAVNVIAGDPERASILYAAHYDTPLREPLPAILCPTRPVTYLLYQALTPVLALVLCFAVSLGVTFALSLPNLTLPLFLVLLIGALAYLKYGPSEKNNVNANTSGVAALPAPPSSSRRATATTSASSFWTAAATICGAPRASASAIRAPRRSPSSASTAWAAETSC